ncbi:LCP family protein [Actinoplanes friuliensis]|uniref:Putative cell envelope-related transcriptional attenuator n=1 Tax=Actinoplanes friuliensis DSM 7358 TaxID=1246995 RepID=U5VR45_9ACTN|nr:LCP family protein [Actinoplanes friuliensis]AGZ39282.1 putative cell envelope-related transcriptional attenuator [Actinoplanes friuliensis DSM 7358]
MRTNKTLWVVVGAVVVLLLAGAGIVVALRSGSDEPDPVAAPSAGPPSAPPASASPAPPPGADITGPLDVLILGVDTRVSIPDWQPHADAIMLLHVDADLKSGYLYSLPRDLRVDVPAFAKNGFDGGNHKLTEAMSYGARVRGTDKPNVEQGYELLARTIEKYTGIKKFDAGAILTFNGLSKLTDALGGVTLKIDQKVQSQHRRPDGTSRTLRSGGGGYVGPQATYLPGTRKLVGWQAIDYARQRYTAGGDYTRQRHQRQLVKALLTQAEDSGLATDQSKLQSVLTALGDTLVYSGERTPIEYAYALRDLTPSQLTLVGLPGASVSNGGGYIGEQLTTKGRGFLKALNAGTADAYLAKNRDLINK